MSEVNLSASSGSAGRILPAEKDELKGWSIGDAQPARLAGFTDPNGELRIAVVRSCQSNEAMLVNAPGDISKSVVGEIGRIILKFQEVDGNDILFWEWERPLTPSQPEVSGPHSTIEDDESSTHEIPQSE